MTETTTINPDEMAALPVGAVVRENMMREDGLVASVDYVKMEGEIWRCTAASGAAAPFFDHVATFPADSNLGVRHRLRSGNQQRLRAG